MKKALILVDIQNDFIPGGALAVPDGDAVVPVANQLMERFDLVVATQDWHPQDHGSFASHYTGKKPGEFVELGGLQQILWPDHCVQGTHGADFVSGLDLDGIHHVVRKGMDREIDSYSGFFDNNHQKNTGLAEYLRSQGVDEVVIMGLATDYCVKFTALDACEQGFRTTVVQEGVRGVEINPGDCDNAFKEMLAAGVRIIPLEAL